MSTTQNIVADYTGKKAQGYMTRSFQSGDTIGQGIIRFEEGLKEKGINLRTINVEDLIKDGTCKFNADGTVDLDFVKLTGKKLQINLEICLDDLEGSWEAEDMGDSANDSLPSPYIQELLTVIAAKVGERIDQLIWQGKDEANEFLGILEQLAADADLPANQNIPLVSGGIDATNVAAEIGKVTDAIPDAVYSNEGDLVLAASSSITRRYMRALAGFGANGQGGAGYQAMGFVGTKPLDFEGIPMYKVGGMPKDTMVAYKVENVAFGTGLLSDFTNLRVIDMNVVGDNTLRVIGKFFAGTKYVYANEIVAYNLPATS